MKPLTTGQKVKAKTELQVGAMPIVAMVPAGTRGVVTQVHAGRAIIDFEGANGPLGIENSPAMLDATVIVIGAEPKEAAS